MKMKRFLAVLLVFCLALSLAACGAKKTEEAAAPATDAGTEAAAGGEYINVMLEVEVASLDPQEATDGTSFEVQADFLDGLMQMSPNGDPVPAMAESYEVSEDGCTYTFHIREDAKWSNGTPVTADDFIFGWQRACDPAVASEYSYMMSDIGQIKNAAEIINGEKGVEELGATAIDEKTLQVELNVPVPFFLSLLYFPTYFPVNREFYNSLAEGTFATSPETTLANGAFILESYEPATLSFSLKKNPDYFDAAKVQLAGINYQVIKDSQQALLNYQNGTLDVTKVSGDQVDQVKDDPELNINGAGYMWYLTMNAHDVPALNNVNMRLAIMNAVDRETIVNDVVKDGSLATFTAVPPQFAASPVDGSDFSADQERYKETCSYNVEAAQAYFAKACEELGTNSFTFELLCEDQTETQNVAAVLKEQLETNLPGLTFNLKVEPKKQRVADIQDGNYEVCLTRWGPDYADPMTYLNMWITDCSNNYGRWSNPEYDAIIADCTTGQYIGDLAARWNALYDAEDIIMAEAVICPLYTKANATMIKSNVKGLEFHPIAINCVYKNATKN